MKIKSLFILVVQLPYSLPGGQPLLHVYGCLQKQSKYITKYAMSPEYKYTFLHDYFTIYLRLPPYRGRSACSGKSPHNIPVPTYYSSAILIISHKMFNQCSTDIHETFSLILKYVILLTSHYICLYMAQKQELWNNLEHNKMLKSTNV